MPTKKVTLYANLFEGWDKSIFPPSLNALPPSPFPGAVLVAVEIALPIIKPVGPVQGVVVSQANPIPFPKGA